MKTPRSIQPLIIAVSVSLLVGCGEQTPMPAVESTSPPPLEAATEPPPSVTEVPSLPPTPTPTPMPAPLMVQIRSEPATGQPSPGQRLMLIAILNPDQPATFSWSISGDAQGILNPLGGNSAEYVAGQAGTDTITVSVVATSGATGSATSTFAVAAAPPVPEQPSPMLADFDQCIGLTNAGDTIGAAFTPGTGDLLREEYIVEADRGCVAKLSYAVTDWAAFWLKLAGRDLSAYNTLTFDIKADPTIGVPTQMKIELKQSPQVLSIVYVTGIDDSWQTMRVPFADFGPAGYGTPLLDFQEMSELVFTFEARYTTKGVVYLDNIAFEQE